MTNEQQLAALSRSLTNVTPTPENITKIEALRDTAKVLGEQIITSTPPSRKRSLAITHLGETVMWAVKGLVLAV